LLARCSLLLPRSSGMMHWAVKAVGGCFAYLKQGTGTDLIWTCGGSIGSVVAGYTLIDHSSPAVDRQRPADVVV
jgi:hypothetical protein